MGQGLEVGLNKEDADMPSLKKRIIDKQLVNNECESLKSCHSKNSALGKNFSKETKIGRFGQFRLINSPDPTG